MKYFLTAAFLFTIVACTTSQKTTPSPEPVGVVTLTNYKLNDSVRLKEDISYRYLTNENDFLRYFHMTKATMETAIVPDFSSQRVVAIMLRPTKKVITLEITKAGIANEELFVYYNLVDTTTTWDAAYEQPITVAATVPKSGSVKKVSFHNNNTKEFTIRLEE